MKFEVKMSIAAIFCFVFFFLTPCKGSTSECLIAVKMSNYQVFMGIQLPIYNESKCYDSCLANDTCIGFDWDYGNPGCFFFEQFETEPSSNVNVTHYIFIRNKTLCTGDFTEEIWIPVMNNASTGVKDVVAANSLKRCVEVCLETLYCKGIDWQQLENNGTCWIVNETAPLHDSYGIYHYRRIRIPHIPQEIRSLYPYPLSIKPAYVVLIGLGLGCILMTVVAVIVIVTRKKSDKNNYYSKEQIFPINALSEEKGDQLSEKYDFEDQGTLSSEPIKFERYDADNAVVETEQPFDTIE